MFFVCLCLFFVCCGGCLFVHLSIRRQRQMCMSVSVCSVLADAQISADVKIYAQISAQINAQMLRSMCVGVCCVCVVCVVCVLCVCVSVCVVCVCMWLCVLCLQILRSVQMSRSMLRSVFRSMH